jgi:hypothetical protein
MSAGTLPAILLVADLPRQHAREVTRTHISDEGQKRDETRWEISPAGQQMLRDNQRARGLWLRDHPTEARELMLAAVRKRADL